jgi:aquaporin Z
MSFGLMLAVLLVISRPRIASRAGLVAGVLVALYIAVEDPVSGMSLNPARTFGSAVPAMQAPGLWIYFVAPPLGMLTAAALFRTRLAPSARHCAKYHHDSAYRCIFCEHQAAVGR